ncbi:MAG: hypothetical protein JRF37_10560 [Deltaproteobacteria bacterium]|nr:hypothetical protein [Deltaproteobacteria bacterium]
MTKLAIPVFHSRIAPVFDSCLRVLVVHIDHDAQTDKSELLLDGLSPIERVSALKRAGVMILVCGGISQAMQTMLEGEHIRVETGISGPVKEVVSAFMSNRLDDPHFYMPGRTGKYGIP